MFTVRPPTGARCAFAVLLMMALTSRAESYLSFTGTVTPNTNPNFEISFSVNTPDTLNARTWAYSGGTNASGEVIAPGGIDSVLNLYTGGNNFVATNDDINAPANLRDSAITVPSATGGYQLFMSAFVGPGGPALGDRHFAVDVRNSSSTDTGFFIPNNVTLKTASFGGVFVPGALGNTVVNTNLTSPLVTTDAITFAGGAIATVNADVTTTNVAVGTAPGRVGFGSAILSQVGGTTTANNLILYGTNSGGGTYALGNGATLKLISEIVDDASSFVQNGGTHTITSALSLGRSLGSPDNGGSFDLNGGSLTVGTVLVNSNSSFRLQGGTLTGNQFTNFGTLTFQGATADIAFSLEEGSSNIVRSSLSLSKPLTLNGGLLRQINSAGIVLTLGPASGVSGHGHVELPIVNNGDARAANGDLLLDGPTLTNNGTLRNDPGANLFVTGTLTNTGNLATSAGGGVYLQSSAQIPANKSLTLKGGTFAAPVLTNAAAGTITGFGNLSTHLTNAGTVTVVGPTNLVGNLTNQTGATITVRNDQLLVTGLTTNNGTITATSGGKVVFEGGLAPAPPVPAPTLDGPVAAGGLDGGGSLTINPASRATASYVRQGQLTLAGSTTDAPALLLLRNNADGGETSVVNTLTLSGEYRLDLADGAMIVNYTGTSPLSTVRAAVLAGYGAGPGPHWAGGGIASSAAAADPSNRAVGYAEASDVLGPGGGAFAGQTADGTSVLLRVTLPGDATLDGAVDFNDLVKLAQNYNTAGGRQWSQGDFNYDGNVDFNDLVFLAQHYNSALPAEPVAGAPDAFSADLARAFADVPEPTAAAWLATAPLLTLRRRNRQRA